MHRIINTLAGITFGLGCIANTASAANFSDESIGVSIDVAEGLSKQTKRDGMYVFSAEDNSAALYVIPAYEVSMYNMRVALQDGKWRGHGINFTVVGDRKDVDPKGGDGLIVLANARVGEFKVRGVFGAFNGKDDRGFLVFAGARPDYWEEWKERIKEMFDSIEVLEIDYTEMLTEWEQRLAGKSLVPNNPPTKGPWTPQALNLCSDGTLLDDDTANPQPAVTYATVWNGYGWVSVPREPPVSSWKVVPDKGRPLLLVGNQIPIEFTLEMKDGQLWMNDKPYDIVKNRKCE